MLWSMQKVGQVGEQSALLCTAKNTLSYTQTMSSRYHSHFLFRTDGTLLREPHTMRKRKWQSQASRASKHPQTQESLLAQNHDEAHSSPPPREREQAGNISAT